MVRITRGNIAVKRRKKYIKLAKSYIGSNSRLSTFATEQVIQSFNFAYISRKLNKRNFRKNWIHIINATVRNLGVNYSSFMGYLRSNFILLNRKMLTILALENSSIYMCLKK